MSEIITVGLNLAKNMFQVHGTAGAGRAVLRKKLRQHRSCSFSAICRRASPRLRLAAARISGAVRSASWATKCD